jgi:hypothetical protein
MSYISKMGEARIVEDWFHGWKLVRRDPGAHLLQASRSGRRHQQAEVQALMRDQHDVPTIMLMLARISLSAVVPGAGVTHQS